MQKSLSYSKKMLSYFCFLYFLLFPCEHKPFFSTIAAILDFTSIVFVVFKGKDIYTECKKGTLHTTFTNNLAYICNNEPYSKNNSLKDAINSLTKDKNEIFLDKFLFICGSIGAIYLSARIFRAIIKKMHQ